MNQTGQGHMGLWNSSGASWLHPISEAIDRSPVTQTALKQHTQQGWKTKAISSCCFPPLKESNPSWLWKTMTTLYNQRQIIFNGGRRESKQRETSKSLIITFGILWRLFFETTDLTSWIYFSYAHAWAYAKQHQKTVMNVCTKACNKVAWVKSIWTLLASLAGVSELMWVDWVLG